VPPTKDGEQGASLSSPPADCSASVRGLGWRVRMMKRLTTVYMDCERCGLPFEPLKGGLCQRCDRILCPADLHGDVLSRWRAAITGRAICVECRAKRAR
jgi:hypothetical protein